MKNKFILCLFFVLPVLLSSCKKEAIDITGKKMAAYIDGKTWDTNVRATVLQNGVFVITGTSILDGILVITINGENPGTYNFSATSLQLSCLATYTPSALNPADTYASTSGKVILTKVDTQNKTISGTFEFTVVNATLDFKSIKSGVFNDISYEIKLPNIQ